MSQLRCCVKCEVPSQCGSKVWLKQYGHTSCYRTPIQQGGTGMLFYTQVGGWVTHPIVVHFKLGVASQQMPDGAPYLLLANTCWHNITCVTHCCSSTTTTTSFWPCVSSEPCTLLIQAETHQLPSALLPSALLYIPSCPCTRSKAATSKAPVWALPS